MLYFGSLRCNGQIHVDPQRVLFLDIWVFTAPDPAANPTHRVVPKHGRPDRPVPSWQRGWNDAVGAYSCLPEGTRTVVQLTEQVDLTASLRPPFKVQR